MLGQGDDHYDSDGWPDWVFVRERVIYRELKGTNKYQRRRNAMAGVPAGRWSGLQGLETCRSRRNSGDLRGA
jgi:hypothetical protein